MAHATPDQVSTTTTTSAFREKLKHQQPEVLSWLEQHLGGASRVAGVELAARYFSTTERWGQVMPMLKHGRLNRELLQQVPSIDPQDRWLSDLPIGLVSGDKRQLGRVLRALVTVSKAQRPTQASPTLAAQGRKSAISSLRK